MTKCCPDPSGAHACDQDYPVGSPHDDEAVEIRRSVERHIDSKYPPIHREVMSNIHSSHPTEEARMQVESVWDWIQLVVMVGEDLAVSGGEFRETSQLSDLDDFMPPYGLTTILEANKK